MTDTAIGSTTHAPLARLLLVDDQALVRTGFRLILEQHGFEVVAEAADGREAIQLTRELTPDVVLMDIRMPNVDGIEATRAIVADSSLDTRVLMLTTFDADEQVLEAVRAGASGFLLKDVPPADLIHAVQVVARGDALLAPAITKRLLERFIDVAPAEQRDVVQPPGFDELTAREVEVFGCIARGLSNAEIAAELYLAETTVKTHVTRLLAKLGARDRVQLVVLAYESGMVEPATRRD